MTPPDEAAAPETAEGLAYVDDLTGLRNRRFLAELLSDGWSELREAHPEVTLLILDLDGFKAVNDRYGHLTGDRVLVEVARILRGSFRADDAIVRYGGDELVVVLPGVGAGEARSLAERARRAVDQHTFRSHPDEEAIRGEVSFSVGVASAPADAAGGEELLAEADRRLFEEKRRRKGRRVGVRAWRVTATVLAILLLGAAAAGWWWSRARPPEAQLESPSPAVLEARAELRRELRREVGRLEGRIEELLAQLAAERSRLRREELAEELAAVEERLSEIEMLTVETPLDGVVPEGREADTAAAPVVSVASADGTTSEPPPDSPPTPPAPAPEPVVPEPEDRTPPATSAPEPLPVLAPRLLEMPEPRYPTIARRLRREATVEIGVLVDPEGRVVEAVAISGPRAHGFREAAEEAAVAARFEPGRVGDQAIEGRTVLVVRFRLDGEGDR